jgi:hypothetical protein
MLRSSYGVRLARWSLASFVGHLLAPLREAKVVIGYSTLVHNMQKKLPIRIIPPTRVTMTEPLNFGMEQYHNQQVLRLFFDIILSVTGDGCPCGLERLIFYSSLGLAFAFYSLFDIIMKPWR